jgi:hypothetical protein
VLARIYICSGVVGLGNDGRCVFSLGSGRRLVDVDLDSEWSLGLGPLVPKADLVLIGEFFLYVDFQAYYGSILTLNSRFTLD